jgi:alpha-galactosidase
MEYLSSAVSAYGLDVLRIDFNLNPDTSWASGDARGPTSAAVALGERTGITELMYVEGLYTMWDALLAQHPGLLIDDCSSGGRRIDVETLSRSFPLWRSDHTGAPLDHQAESMGLSNFAPVSSGAVLATDPHSWRSAGVVGKTISWGLAGWQKVLASAESKAELDAAVRETQSIRDVALNGDYFPIVGGALNGSGWGAYQFANSTVGFAYFFRNNAGEDTIIAALQAIDVGCKRYTVDYFYGYALNRTATVAGATLRALQVTLPAARQGDTNASLLIKYTKPSDC